MGFREEILRTSFIRYEGKFASGAEANNKLDAERIKDNPSLKGEVIKRLGNSVLEWEPEFVVGVPDGARWIADSIAEEFGVATFHLNRTGESKAEVGFMSLEDQEVCEALRAGVLVEDVFSKFTSTRRTLSLPELTDKIIAVEAVWDRGCEPREKPSMPCRALITEQIDTILPEDSELWKFANE